MLSRISEKNWVWILIAIYVLVFGTITSLRHYNFQTQTWDFAVFVQSLWNAAHGNGLINSLEQVPRHMGLHFSPILYLLTPGYWIFNSPYFLLWAQTLALALGAWPLYLLAKKLLPGRWPLLISAAYLLYPSLHWVNTYDFHEISLFVPLFLSALYFIEIQKLGWASLFLAFSAGVKEDAIIAVVFAGLYMFFRKNGRKAGLITAIAGVALFLIATRIIMPAAGGGILRIDRYNNILDSPTIGNILSTIFTADKLIYALWLLLPVAFLPLVSLKTLILFLPGLPENLLTDYAFQFSGIYHYDAILIPAIFVGTIYGLKKLLEKWPDKEKMLRLALVGTIIAAFITHSPIGPFSFPFAYFQKSAQRDAYHQLVKIPPPEASVAANTNLVPHLAHRQFVYALGREPALVDIVIADLNDTFGFATIKEFQKYLQNYVDTGVYKTLNVDDRFLIFISNKFKLVP